MKKLRAIALLLLTGQIGLQVPVLAATIDVSPRQAVNLGISVISPRSTDRTTTLNAMANVVLPPQSDSAVAALQSGVITRLHVGTGDPVVAGQPMADIMSQAFLTLQSDYLNALGTQSLNEATRVRDEQLHVEGIVSLRRLNETSNRAAEAELHLAEQRQLLLLNGLRTTDLRQLETTRTLFQSLTVRSPMTGDVLKRWVGTGDQVSPGEPLFRVGNLQQMWLEIQVPAQALPRIEPGFSVTRNTPGTEQELARITVITKLVESGSQKVIVRAETTSAQHRLLPGERIEVTVHVPGPATADSITWEVPARAITHKGAQPYLFTKNASGFDPVPVTEHGGTGEIAFVEGDIDEQSEIALTGVAALKAIWLSSEG